MMSCSYEFVFLCCIFHHYLRKALINFNTFHFCRRFFLDAHYAIRGGGKVEQFHCRIYSPICAIWNTLHFSHFQPTFLSNILANLGNSEPVLPIMNKDHQTQKTNQIRTKILAKYKPKSDNSKIQTPRTQSKQMQTISKQKI